MELGEPEGEPPAEDHPPDEEENEDYDIHARKDLDDGSGTKRPPPDSGSYSMKAMRVTVDAATAPWELPEFSTPPPTGKKDRWESSWIQRGWLVRVHRDPRKRTFQPIHRASPVAGGDLLPLRVTVGFEEDTNRRFVKTDRWDVEPANPATSRWTGWTFFRLKNETGTVHDRTVSRSSSDDARGEGHRFHLPERDGAGETA